MKSTTKDAADTTEPEVLPRAEGRYHLAARVDGDPFFVHYRGTDSQVGRTVRYSVILNPWRWAAGSILDASKKLLGHERPGVLTTHYVSADRGILVTDLPHGTALELVGCAPLPDAEVARLGRDWAAGLHAGHTEGCIHGRVEPMYLCLASDGSGKVDGWWAHAADRQIRPTLAGIRKPRFYAMAPEQAVGAHLDACTDVYLLAAVLFHLLTGRELIPHEGLLARMSWLVEGDLSQVQADLEKRPGIGSILCRALERKPRCRFQSASEFANALSGLVT